MSGEKKQPKPGRDRFGKFVRGNLVAKRHGLWQRVKFGPGEEIRIRRLESDLRAAGWSRPIAESLAVEALGAMRLEEDFLAASTGEERATLFNAYERAAQIMARVRRALQGPGTADEDDGPVPLWRQGGAS